MNKIYKYLLDQLEKNIPLALATIVATKGSTPQVKGASAIFSGDRLIQGTLGGGMLEADAQKKACQAIQEQDSRLYEFDLNAVNHSDDAALCGGKAVILIDACPGKSLNILRMIEKSIHDRQPGIIATLIGKYKNAKVEISRYWVSNYDMDLAGLDEELSGYGDQVKKCMKENQTIFLPMKNSSHFIDASETFLFLEPVFPSSMLIIAGAGHVGQAVAHLGSLLDFEVTMIDDRPEFCNNKMIPDADHFIVEDIGTAIHKIPVTTETFIVIVTRGHRNDADALRACMNSDAAYIGMIGSKRKVRLTRQKFLAEGWATPSRFDSIYAPIGIEIGSNTVQEIAVSICAQLILIRQQKQKNKKKAAINAVILAAGESRRMGKPKLLMPYGESTIIDTVIGEATRSGVNEIVVVLGSEKDRIRMQIKDYPLIITENHAFQHGMLSSVQCGIRVLPENTDAVLLLLGDQPMIPASVIDNVIDAFRQTGKGIVIAVHDGKRGHPILFDIKYREEVEQLGPDHSLHDLTRKFPEDILEIEVGTPVVLRDIDTIEDYNKELKYRRLT